MMNLYQKIISYKQYCTSMINYEVKPVDILLCTICNDAFFPGTIVMLYSMQKYLKNFNKYKIRIFTDNDISPLSKDHRKILREFSSNIEIINVENQIYRDAKVEVPKHRLAYLTLEIFNQNDFNNIVFFDGDMLALQDFSDAFNFSFPIFGSRVGKYKSKMGPRIIWRYINTGFFGISKKLLPDNIYEIFMDIVSKRNDKRLSLLDQKIINNYFSNNKYPYLLLNHYYNFRNFGAGDEGSEELLQKHLRRIKILHYSGYKVRPKPWEFDRILSCGFQKNYAYKVWNESANELVKLIPELEKTLIIKE